MVKSASLELYIFFPALISRSSYICHSIRAYSVERRMKRRMGDGKAKPDRGFRVFCDKRMQGGSDYSER